MAEPRKYPDELRARAMRMAVDARRDPLHPPRSLPPRRERLGTSPETLRGWVTQAEVDEGHRPGGTTAEAQRIADLEREVRELCCANKILTSVPASFARCGRSILPSDWARVAPRQR